VEVGPSEASKVARLIGTVVSQQKHRISDNILICILNTNVGVCCGNVLVGIVLESLLRVIGEDDEGGWGLGTFYLAGHWGHLGDMFC
jgi:hypothetical protein